MIVGLMFSMGYPLFSPSDHEWSGTILLIMFVFHHLLNRKWYGHLMRGRHTARRALNAAANAALLAFVSLLMCSGIAVSQHVFTFLPVMGGTSVMRRLHLMSSGWVFVLVAFHCGLHWHEMPPALQRGASVRQVLFWCAAAIAAYGIYAFLSRDLIGSMFLMYEFAALHCGESPLLFYADYAAVFVLFIFAGRGAWLLAGRNGKQYS